MEKSLWKTSSRVSKSVSETAILLTVHVWKGSLIKGTLNEGSSCFRLDIIPRVNCGCIESIDDREAISLQVKRHGTMVTVDGNVWKNANFPKLLKT
jgi:hypothetical protein